MEIRVPFKKATRGNCGAWAQPKLKGKNLVEEFRESHHGAARDQMQAKDKQSINICLTGFASVSIRSKRSENILGSHTKLSRESRPQNKINGNNIGQK